MDFRHLHKNPDGSHVAHAQEGMHGRKTRVVRGKWGFRGQLVSVPLSMATAKESSDGGQGRGRGMRICRKLTMPPCHRSNDNNNALQLMMS